jgi:hypothetical protein
VHQIRGLRPVSLNAFDELKKSAVFRNIGHRVSSMHIPDEALGIDHCHKWHATQLEQVNLLPVQAGDLVPGIRDPDERNALGTPVPAKFAGALRTYGDHFCCPAGELGIVVSQARQLRAAIGSGKAAEKGQHNDLAAKIP